MTSGPICFPENDTTLFSFMAEWKSTVLTHYALFVHSAINGQQAVPTWPLRIVLQWIWLSRRLQLRFLWAAQLGHRVVLFLGFLRKLNSDFHSDWTNLYTFPRILYKLSFFLMSFFCICYFLLVITCKQTAYKPHKVNRSLAGEQRWLEIYKQCTDLASLNPGHL